MEDDNFMKEIPSLESLLTSGKFSYGVELITTRGRLEGNDDRRLRLGGEYCASPLVSWISITDNPGGYPMIPAESLARVFSGKKTTLIHLSCRDRNRASLESAAWEYASEGFNDLLVVGGDYPRESFGGCPAPVFDLDAVGLLAMLTGMNKGLETARKGKTVKLAPTAFYLGCAVSPYKTLPAEVMSQYLKLARKMSAGARFVFPQFGFDMRKALEPVQYLKSRGLTPPFIGNVYILTPGLVELIHSGGIPGCVLSDELHSICAKYSGGTDRGKAFFLELAAKQLASYRALGFAAGYLGGASSAVEAEKVLSMANSFTKEEGLRFAKEIRYPFPGEFHLFNEDGIARLPERTTCTVTMNYRVSRRIHQAIFNQGGLLNSPVSWFYRKVAPAPGLVYRAFHFLERGLKAALYGCRDCGDCSLPESGFICPIASCPKHQRNGPCGGSKDGICELGDRPCMWVCAYERLAYHHEAEKVMTAAPFVPDSALIGTSSWANSLLNRKN